MINYCDFIPLFSESTGLPMSIKVGNKFDQDSQTFIFVNKRFGNKSKTINDYFWVDFFSGKMEKNEYPKKVQEAILKWIYINKDSLIRYWHDEIDSLEFCHRMKEI